MLARLIARNVSPLAPFTKCRTPSPAPPSPCSAFPNARALAKQGAARQLVGALRGHEQHPQATTIALSNALKQVSQ